MAGAVEPTHADLQIIGAHPVNRVLTILRGAADVRSWKLSPLARNRDGSVAAEFALVIPLMLALIFGTIEFGRVIWLRTTLQSAAEDTVRCYSLKLPACDTAAKVQTYGSSVAMGLTATFTASEPACGKEVIASAPFAAVVPLVPLNFTVQARACRPTL